jgi:hypothetical protein
MVGIAALRANDWFQYNKSPVALPAGRGQSRRHLLADEAENRRQHIIYIREDGRYVLVVKATQDGGELYVTTLYRLHTDEAMRDREIARLLRKEKKK